MSSNRKSSTTSMQRDEKSWKIMPSAENMLRCKCGFCRRLQVFIFCWIIFQRFPTTYQSAQLIFCFLPISVGLMIRHRQRTRMSCLQTEMTTSAKTLSLHLNLIWTKMTPSAKAKRLHRNRKLINMTPSAKTLSLRKDQKCTKMTPTTTRAKNLHRNRKLTKLTPSAETPSLHRDRKWSKTIPAATSAKNRHRSRK